MRLTIDRLQTIEDDYLDNFKFKRELSEVELYGLEYILSNLVKDLNYELGIDSDSFEFVGKYTVHKLDCLDVLDGCSDVISLGDYAISNIYLTENGIPVLKCYQIDEDYCPIDDSEYYVSVG